VSGISRDYSESELIKMASPFSHPVEVLMATEVDMETCLEWKKVCAILEYNLLLFFFNRKCTFCCKMKCKTLHFTTKQ